MKYAVEAWSKGSRARTGVLQICTNQTATIEIEIETPCLLFSTRKGLPHFISPDHLSSSFNSPFLLQLCPLHFLEGISTKTISKIGGLQHLLGLRGHGFAAIGRDSISCLPEYTACNKTGASFDTPFGRHLIKPVDYMQMITAMMPNIWATLADEVPAWVSDKRNKTSVDRTVRWLDECICSSPGGGTAFGAIVGGSSVEERQRCAREVVKRDVSGYWIGGFGLGERMEERPALLDAVTEILPEERPRLISGLSLPEEVLQGIAAGIDLFDSTYIYHLTLEGFALTFPLHKTVQVESKIELSDIGGDKSKINLRATFYRKDTSPIVENCACYTCKNHTKAYINHLLNVHEMLAHILLEIHNTHHYLGFFQSIREAIRGGKFEQFRQEFVQSRHQDTQKVAQHA